MKKNELFEIKKGNFSSDKYLKILEDYIAPFLSLNNSYKLRANGGGPSLENFKVKTFEKILKYEKFS